MVHMPPDLFLPPAPAANGRVLDRNESRTIARVTGYLPMTTSFARQPERHRERAAACRRLSERAYTADLRDSYLHLAESYEELANTEETLERFEP